MIIIIKGSKLKLIESRLANPVPLLKRIGAMMKGRVKSSFRDQGRDGLKWKARGVPNVIGIIKDMDAGRKSIPARRFEPRPAGRDTGLLQRSIDYVVSSPKPGAGTVEIGSSMQYATDLQRGGQRRVPVSSVTRNNLRVLVDRARKKIKKGAGSQKDKMIAQLGWLLFASNVKVNVPARPYAYFSDKDAGDVVQAVRDYIAPGGAAGAVAVP